MKDLLGFLLIVGGILLGAYVGVWLCLIGGIVGLIEASRVTPIVPMDIAINLVKILFSGAVGQFTLLVPVAIGTAILKS